jgi:hypothetical protein
MVPILLLALLFVPGDRSAVSPDRSSPPADPCRLARRIAEAPPCLDPADCQAVDLWRQSFGAPQMFHASPDMREGLPRALASRLPDRQISLQEKEPLDVVLRRLAEGSKLEVAYDVQAVAHQYDGEAGTVSLDEAWRRVLKSGRLSVAVEGDAVMVWRERGPSGRRMVASFNCPAR